jgi:hypothetical protein
VLGGLAMALAAVSPEVIAALVAGSVVGGVAVFGVRAAPAPHLWDRSMLHLPPGQRVPWYASLWLWWAAAGICFLGIYLYFW